MTRRVLLGRMRAVVAVDAGAEAVPPVEVWLPVKDGSDQAPGRYPDRGGRMVLVLYDPDDPAATEARP